MAFSENGRGFDPTRDRKGRRIIPEGEMDITYARSGGAGGQNVNKRETKAVLKWKVGGSKAFSEDEKARIRQNLPVTTEDEIVLHCDEERQREQNRRACVERLHEMVHVAIQVPEERVATKKPRGVKAREAASDFREKKKKAGRGKVDWRE